VSEPASISSGIAARYATALFDLSKEENGLGALEKDVDLIDAALSASADLRDLISSPIYSRDDQGNAIAAIAAKSGLSALTTNTLKLMAAKRRLFVLPQLVADLRALPTDGLSSTVLSGFRTAVDTLEADYEAARGTLDGYDSEALSSFLTETCGRGEITTWYVTP